MKISLKYLLTVVFIIWGQKSVLGQTCNYEQNKDLILSDWKLKSSVLEHSNGEEISTGNYHNSQWYPAKVPTTVLKTLVANGVYPDPRIDMNNYLIPDVSDEFNKELDLTKYSYLPNKENPWKDPYWFITEFEIPEEYKGKAVWLNFNGINYRGEVWLNGKKISDPDQMIGMLQRFRYNVTSSIKEDDTNYLAVKIFQVDHPGLPGTQFEVFGKNRKVASDIWKDLTLKMNGGGDCGLAVRDRNIGLYQDVYINFTDEIDIIHPYIVTDLPLPDTTIANLTITATLQNISGKTVKGLLKGKIDLLTEIDMVNYVKELPGNMSTISFEKEVEVPAYNTITVSLSYKDFPQLSVKDPYLWYPNGYGEQYLHNMELSFENGKGISSSKNTMFGIRETYSVLKELNGEAGRVFYVNGKKIFCRGGWLQPDLLLDMDKKKMYDEGRLLANANVNTVGTEDMPSPPEDYVEMLDKYGLIWWEIFYQCWTTEPGTKNAYNPVDHYWAIESQRDIILRHRNSPSLVAWCTENEGVPGPDLYYKLKEQLNKYDQTRTFLASTSVWWDWEKLTPYIAEDMPVGTTDDGRPDYTWETSSYYFEKVKEVYQQMFRNELGIPAIPTLSSLKKFIYNLGEDKTNPIFPLDSVWAEHGAWDGDGYAFRAYDKAIRDVYGCDVKSVEEYVRTAQIVNADGYRAMFEAANSRMWDITSGVMLWKLNSCYPMVLWQIYDWYLNPNAAYYFTQKACEPVHVQMSADTKQVSIINTLYEPLNNIRVKAKVYDFDMNVKWNREEEINMNENCYQEIFKVPQLSNISPVYFVKLELLDKKGDVISENTYWQSSESPDNFSELSKLKDVKLKMDYDVKETEYEYIFKVKVKNLTKKLSFMNRLALVKKDNMEEVLPTIWNDNFITLFPGESRIVEARVSKKDVKDSEITIVIDNNM